VLSRGNERKDIFHDDRDRLTFLEAIGEMTDNYDVDVFAYVLMSNHYHILLRTNQANLSKSMQWLALTYTWRFNKTYATEATPEEIKKMAIQEILDSRRREKHFRSYRQSQKRRKESISGGSDNVLKMIKFC